MKLYSILCNERLELGYNVYLPDNDSNNRLPLIFFLHGAGESGNGVEDLEKLALVGIPKYINESKSYPAIILMPQCTIGMVWNNIIFALKKLIDKVVTEYNVDNNRISVTGLSMGGFGTWELDLSYPIYFSALAPICGEVSLGDVLPLKIHLSGIFTAVSTRLFRLIILLKLNIPPKLNTLTVLN